MAALGAAGAEAGGGNASDLAGEAVRATFERSGHRSLWEIRASCPLVLGNSKGVRPGQRWLRCAILRRIAIATSNAS